MDDYITKKDALDAIRKIPYFDIEHCLIAPEIAIDAISSLDPLHEPWLLEQIRPKGHWIATGYMEEIYGEQITCSNCGKHFVISDDADFCPGCGAKMVFDLLDTPADDMDLEQARAAVKELRTSLIHAQKQIEEMEKKEAKS